MLDMFKISSVAVEEIHGAVGHLFDLGSERLQLPQLILQKWCDGHQARPEEFEIGCDVIELWDCIFDTQAMLTIEDGCGNMF